MAPRRRCGSHVITRPSHANAGAVFRALNDGINQSAVVMFNEISIDGDRSMNDATYKYVQGTLTITNAVPGQRLSVVLVPGSTAPADQVSWSMGAPMQPNSTGIQLNASGGVAAPVSSLSISDTAIIVNTSSNGGGSGSLTFAVSAWLVAPATLQQVNMKSMCDPGVIATFQFSGQQPIVLNQTVTAFSWPS